MELINRFKGRKLNKVSSNWLLDKLYALPRRQRQVLLIVFDYLLIAVSIAAAHILSAGDITQLLSSNSLLLFLFSATASVWIFVRLGLYRALVRYMGHHAIITVLKAVSLSTLVMCVGLLVTEFSSQPLMPVLYALINLLLIGGMRLVVRALYQGLHLQSGIRVAIYGAGQSGRGLLSALNHSPEYRAVLFIDDNETLHHNVINGVPVYPSAQLGSLIEEFGIAQVMLAIPSVARHRRLAIIERLESLPVYVRTVPDFDELVAGRAKVSEIQDIKVEDLLGREPVPPNPKLLASNIAGKAVMVTGAGGSIGAELCRQILRCAPKELILFEQSEYALYKVHQDLEAQIEREDLGEIPLIPLLGSAQDRAKVREVYQRFGIQTVYHAAAYKHVPLVEFNVVEGVKNNVFATWESACAAMECGVETFVLVSSDKAVRPTNVMGASKRLAELILQSLAQKQYKTRFSMVRFGNVLGSSGSVVPLFREQIANGGPVTVTHKEVTRYFMTIEEASQLVIQAGSMATGGDVFVLDMGEPVKILDLAYRMAHLMGMDVAEDRPQSGQVAIEFTGLRPGEKLYEELLVGNNVSGTGHPRIMRAEEEHLSSQQLEEVLEELRASCDAFDCESLQCALQRAISGFEPNEQLSDVMWSRTQRITADNVLPLHTAKS